jgi:hypothetical protein
MCVFTACQQHSHEFTERIITNEYLATEATCKAGATYYYACKCGEKGDETFKFKVLFEDRGGEMVPYQQGAYQIAEIVYDEETGLETSRTIVSEGKTSDDGIIS